MGKGALTVGQLMELLRQQDPDQKIVFSDIYFGDFDVLGFNGNCLSEDNFVHDRRPIFQISKRRD